MTYRDDLGAAQARGDELERELAEARSEIAALKEAKRVVPPPAQHAPTGLERRVRPIAGRLHYDPPRTYAPLLAWLQAVARSAWACAWSTRPRPTDSDRLIAILAYWLLLWPLVNLVWRPLYLVALATIVLPFAAAVAVAGTVVLLPIIVLARVRVGDERPARAGDGWPQGTFDDTQARVSLWVLMSVALPFLLPLFIPLLTRREQKAGA